MTFNNKIVEKEFKKAKAKFYGGAALLVLTVVLLVVGLLNYASSKKNMAPLGEVIDGGNKINKLAYVDIYDFIQFASKGDDLGYYIGYDDDRYYIISISSSDYGYVVRQFNEAGKGNTFRLYGHTVSIPLEARGYAIEALNEAVGDTVVSTLSFDEVFGKVYLSVEKEAQSFSFDSLISVSGGYLLGGIFTLITGLTLFFVGRSQRKSFAANEGDGGLFDSEVMEQINREDTVWLEKVHIYLTEKYLVSVRGSMDAIRYEDVFWAYVTQHRTNAVRDYDYLNIATKEGRMYICANGPTFGKKKQEETAATHGQILQTIKEKNENARIGYDKLNLEAYNELQKKIKENKKSDPQI